MGGKKGDMKRSPCIDQCEFSGPKGWCLGCGRTRQECKGWKSLKPYARNNLYNELRRRMARMKAEPPKGPDERP